MREGFDKQGEVSGSWEMGVGCVALRSFQIGGRERSWRWEGKTNELVTGAVEAISVVNCKSEAKSPWPHGTHHHQVSHAKIANAWVSRQVLTQEL